MQDKIWKLSTINVDLPALISLLPVGGATDCHHSDFDPVVLPFRIHQIPSL